MVSFDTDLIFVDLLKSGQISNFISYKVLSCSPEDAELIKFYSAFPEGKAKESGFPPNVIAKIAETTSRQNVRVGLCSNTFKNVFIILVIFKGALIDLVYKRLTWI